jgi:outer membrane protein insertion porin family
LEANAEYRFPIIGFLKGATFIDAGNTWLLSKSADTSLQNSQFTVNRFYKEVALGTGAGLRLDVSFFILRFDLGIPIRKPWPNKPETIKLDNGSWRKENMIWNIAIGYPF